MEFSSAKMAVPARQKIRFATKEALKLVMHRGSDDAREDTCCRHDQDPEDELFEDASVNENSDDNDIFESR